MRAGKKVSFWNEWIRSGYGSRVVTVCSSPMTHCLRLGDQMGGHGWRLGNVMPAGGGPGAEALQLVTVRGVAWDKE